ncbi:MAG: metal-dependent hydrolase [Desulfobacteraceae bacterium]|nr:metal-dependent hydrolase [Desulfobacteraceae bacterium]
MLLKLTWFGHSCFLLETASARVLIDPFLGGREVAADYILVSHGHGDHLGDTVAVARRTGATVVANFEITSWLAKQGIKKTHAQHIGGGFDHPWGRVKLTIAHHGSSLPDGSYGGNPCGFLLSAAGKKIYFAGDTGLFYDMKLIGEEGIDLAILPIGDNYTMGPADALRAVKLIGPGRVVPCHYDTFKVIRQDPHAWAAEVERTTGARATVMAPGETIDI